MAITIDGIKISSISIQRDENGLPKLTGNYELVSATGVTIAKQSFNGYNDIKLTNSSETQKVLTDFMMAVQTDLNTTLGLN